MTRPDLHVVTDADTTDAHQRHLQAAVLRLESAARLLVDTVDLRKRRGWHKTPMDAVERLREALAGFHDAMHPGDPQ